ncbi:hypothetical protein BS78_03G232300 [Paspalum vaginatum]|nr:hypothetical protein BS78_03G232300 [Paspalum vaginatum]
MEGAVERAGRMARQQPAAGSRQRKAPGTGRLGFNSASPRQALFPVPDQEWSAAKLRLRSSSRRTRN